MEGEEGWVHQNAISIFTLDPRKLCQAVESTPLARASNTGTILKNLKLRWLPILDHRGKRSMRDRIFLSYSHKDSAWQERFTQAFGGGIYAQNLDLWSDTQIPTGSDWQREIESAISTARVGLLLVSRNFLASDFIINKELRSILRRHALAQSSDAEGLSIWWVPIGETTPTERDLAGLGRIQAAHGLDPAKPLSEYDERTQDKKIYDIVAQLLSALKVLPDLDSRILADLKEKVEAALLSNNTILQEPIAPGDYTIIYRAQRFNKALAVKALVPSLRMSKMANDFVLRAQIADRVKSETAIAIREVVEREDIKCVVMEYSDAKTLSAFIKQRSGGLACMEVASILAQLAEVAAELHAADPDSVVGPIRPSHVYFDEESGKVQISLVHIANETLRSCRQKPTMLLDNTALTYLSPERYEGITVDAFSDQYYLGLLGLELLSGCPPVEVSTFAGLEKKKRFFEDPREFFPDTLRCNPDLSFVLARALQRTSGRRWKTMRDLAKALYQIADASVPDAVRSHASMSYTENIQGKEQFFRYFYDSLCESSPDIAKMFDPNKMQGQYNKLDAAIAYLFSFNRQIEPTTLAPQVRSHSQYALTAEHFGNFQHSFISALSKIGVTDPDSLDAWRAVLAPALNYMQERTTALAAGKQY